ncbi:hypothetical protein [Mesorhizobium sp. CN2-181]|uniref:hypothetical protein n=1 Tax=Mesorhizobium yinganensis TaxID=3157707 RepID=UPI0032B8786A
MAMSTIGSEIRDFLVTKRDARAYAAQLAALQILCGIDLAAALASEGAARAGAIARVDRLLVRERMKGLAGHWSYDLNRHIALKQAGDRLKESRDGGTGATRPRTKDGAKRRRQRRTQEIRGLAARSRDS